MNSDPQNRAQSDAMLATAKDALDDSVEHLDAQTLSRLNQSRQAALAQHERASLSTFWMSAGAVAMLSVAVVVGSLALFTPETAFENIDEAEFIASNDEIELMEELEFVTWLVAQEHDS